MGGIDGAKKVDGIKRHILVDTAGILIAATLTPANVQDRAAFPALLRKAKRVAPTPIAHLWLDNGYTGHTAAQSATQAGVSIDVVSGPKPANGFQVQPRRWVVERTNGWINHCRRLDRHYEVTHTAHEASSTSARSPYYYADSTAPSCSTRFSGPRDCTHAVPDSRVVCVSAISAEGRRPIRLAIL